MRTIALGLVLLATITATAHADAPGMTEPAPLPAVSDDGPKSEGGATALAIGGSLLGPALITAAFLNDQDGAPAHGAVVPMMVAGCAFTLLGPSLGNWYAGKPLSTGLEVRLLGVAGTGLGLSMFVAGLFESGPTALIGAGIGLAGLGTVALGTVLDVIDASSSARDYNRNHHHLAIAPMISRTPTGQQTGLSLGGVF